MPKEASPRLAPRSTVYLIETGFPDSLPGFKRGFPAASFPFWGDYYFLDFAITNFQNAGMANFYILADNRYRSLLSLVVSRWENEASSLIFLEGGLSQFLGLLQSDPSQTVIIATLSLACIMEAEAISSLGSVAEEGILKLSVDNVPVDIYLADRRRLIEVLEGFLYRNHRMKDFENTLFQEILLTSFNDIREVPGMLLFNSNLMQMYRENMWLLTHMGSEDHIKILNRLSQVKISDKQALIDNSSHVKDSIIAAGAHIEGYVEGSIIFSDVIVHQGARVINSIVMNNNRIGRQTQIHNALIFPSLEENPRSQSNIGDKSVIGARRSAARNDLYPEHIHDGLTVLGLNPEIPNGYTIEPGCLIGPGVPLQQLQSRRQMRRGSTLLWDTVQ